MLESEKAEQLSNMLGVPVSYYYYITRLFHEENFHEIQVVPEQVVLAQTPMRCLTEYHNKHVLICGQGPIEEIARK